MEETAGKWLAKNQIVELTSKTKNKIYLLVPKIVAYHKSNINDNITIVYGESALLFEVLETPEQITALIK